MDPLSMSCAALQLLGCAANAVKISRFLYKKFKTFRHLSKEISRIFTNVDCQRIIYRVQLHLLLQHAQQHEDVIERMLEDTAHPQWTSEELQVGLEKVFSKSLSACLSTIEQIDAVLSNILGEIGCFDMLTKLKHEVRQLRVVG